MSSAFISYSSEDKNFVYRVALDLKDHGIKVWLDEWEIDPGDDVRQKIEYGIENYEYFIMVLSNHSVNSPWVQKELSAALNKEVILNNEVVVPLLIEKNVEIPTLICGKKYISFRQSSSPPIRRVVVLSADFSCNVIVLRSFHFFKRENPIEAIFCWLCFFKRCGRIKEVDFEKEEWRMIAGWLAQIGLAILLTFVVAQFRSSVFNTRHFIGGLVGSSVFYLSAILALQSGRKK